LQKAAPYAHIQPAVLFTAAPVAKPTTANSCCGDESTWFLRLRRWSQAVCQGNPILYLRKPQPDFPCPLTSVYWAATEAQAGK